MIEGIKAWLAREPSVGEAIEVIFHIYGDDAGVVESRLRSSGLPQLKCTGPVAHAASIERQLAATALVLFAWNTDLDVVPAKVFEYIAASRPILVVGNPDSEVARIVMAAGAGAAAATPEDVARILSMWFERWTARLSLPQASRETIDSHHFRQRVVMYDDVLRSIVRGAETAD
jgi:hypothetical protein